MKTESRTNLPLSGLFQTTKRFILDNIFLVIGIVLIFLVRMLWLETTISRDEGAFGFIGMMWSRGVLPTHWLDIQGPMTYGIYAITISMFGNSIVAIRLLNSIFMVVSCIALYLITLDIFGKKTAIFTLLFYGVALNVAVFEAMTALTEPLSAPFMLLSIFFCYRYCKNPNKLALFLSGFLMSVAVLIRAINLVGFLVLFVILFQRADALKRSFSKELLWVLSGTLVPLFALISYFGINGDLSGLFALYERSFGFSATIHVFQDVPLLIKELFVIEGLPLWVFSIIGLAAVAKLHKQTNFPLLFWAGIYLVVSLIPPTFGHRMILLLSIASVFAGVGLFSAEKWIKRHVVFGEKSARRTNWFSTLLITVTLVALFIPVVNFQKLQYPQLSFQYGDTSWSYADSDYRTQTAVSKYLISNTSPEDRIFVHGWAAEIYWLSGKPAPTKYVWSLSYLPETEYENLVGLISKCDFKYIVVFSPTFDDLFDRAEYSDQIVRYFLYYYFPSLSVNNAWIFGKFDQFGRRVDFNFIENFNDSSKFYDLGNGTFGDTAKLEDIFSPTVTIRSINNDTRYSLQQVPFGTSTTGEILKSSISYQVQIPVNASLRFGIGIDPVFWDDASETNFEVYLNRGFDSLLLFNRTINPAYNALDRNWIDCQVDLSRFANETADVVFSVSSDSSGRNHDSFANWGNPILVAG